MLLSIENYGEHLDENEPKFLTSTDNIFHPPDHQKLLPESVVDGFHLSPKSALAAESPYIPFDLAAVNCVFSGSLDRVNLLSSHPTASPINDMDLADLVKTDNPKVLCTRLPQHYRSNKSLPNTFAVIIRDFNISNGTQVVISASNPENPNSALRNNTAVVSGVVEGYGKIAKFSDLRFVGRSGRGKFFSVTISIFSEPKIIATYHRAIKVTVDGPRTSRKIGGTTCGNGSPSSLANGRLKHVHGGIDSRSENGSTSPESVSSSMCQSPDLATIGYVTKMPPSVSPPTNMQSSSPYGQPFPMYQGTEDELPISQSWPGSEKGSNFDCPTFLNYSCGATVYEPNIQYSIPENHMQLFPVESSARGASGTNVSSSQQDVVQRSNRTSNSQGPVLPPVQTFQQPQAPVFQETSVTTRCISYHPQMTLPQVHGGFIQQEGYPVRNQTQILENHQNINQSMPVLNTQKEQTNSSQNYNNPQIYFNHQTPNTVYANEFEYKQTTRSLGYLNSQGQFDNESYQNFLEMVPTNSLETFNVHDNHTINYDVIKGEPNISTANPSGVGSNFSGGLTANTCQMIPVSGDLAEEHVWRPY